MDIANLRKLLSEFKNGKVSEEEVLNQLRALPFESLGFANVDHHRSLRRGFPEVIFCQGKTKEQIVKIAQSIAARKCSLLATRATKEIFEAVKAVLPEAQFNETARTITLKVKEEGQKKEDRERGTILIVSAGTSDIPIAEEAAVTAEIMGNPVEKLFDVGVAGIHRLLAHREIIERASVIIVVAGMEGALASVVGGLVDVPVIAVPTSVGYGASFGGIAALLAMLNSCASGVVVVNIDNGFGAGYAAALINRKSRK